MTLSFSAPEALVAAPRLTGIAANDAGMVVASVAALDGKGSAYRTSLFRIDGPTAEPLTQGPGSVQGWALADDGEVLFAATRPTGTGDERAEEGRLWALPMQGEARLLASRPGGFEEVVAAGDQVVVTAGRLPSAASEAEHRALAKEREDAGVSAVLHESFPVRYWDADRGPEVDAVFLGRKPAGARGLTLGELPLPPGRLDGVLAGPGVVLATVVGVEGTRERRGVWRLRAEGPELLAAGTATHETRAVALSPDGTRVILEEERAWTGAATMSVRLLLLDLATGEARPLFPEAEAWLEPVWWDDETVVATSDFQGRGAVWVGSVGEAAPRLLAGGAGQPWHFTHLSRAGDALVALRAAIDAPPEPVRIDPTSGEMTPLPNPVPPVRRSGRLEEVGARGEDGMPLRGWLALPEGPGPHPLLVFVHGGPWGSWNTWSWRWNPWAFTSEGYAVLLPDPAISTGYG